MPKPVKLTRPISAKRVALQAELIRARARENFRIFRHVMHPDMVWGWWTVDISRELQQFYFDLLAGRRPKLAIMAPPQHGKSTAAVDFIAWLAGKNPDNKTIFASYSDPLGVRTNLDLQRRLGSDSYRRIFPNTRINTPGWKHDSSLIEFAGHRGSFRNVTVMGGVTGFELNFGVIDDPVKGRAEASSKIIRDRTWSWFTDDWLARFAKDAAMLVIMTRWHPDDLLGRALERDASSWKVLRYPAIAEEDGVYRRKGEPLFPEFKPLDYLLERKRMLTQAGWESLYQQRPIAVGGGMLPVDKLRVVPFWSGNADVARSVRYWDKAASEDRSAAYTAGVLMHQMTDGRFVISHVCRGHWSALDREQQIKAMAKADAAVFKNYQVVVEMEPGSGGKESAEATIRNLRGFRVYADQVTGSKEVRAEPFAAQVQGGNVWLVAGEWVRDFLDEAEVFPQGKRKDQIDAAAGAFNRLILASTYNTNFKEWVGW